MNTPEVKKETAGQNDGLQEMTKDVEIRQPKRVSKKSSKYNSVDLRCEN